MSKSHFVKPVITTDPSILNDDKHIRDNPLNELSFFQHKAERTPSLGIQLSMIFHAESVKAATLLAQLQKTCKKETYNSLQLKLTEIKEELGQYLIPGVAIPCNAKEQMQTLAQRFQAAATDILRKPTIKGGAGPK